MKLKNLQDIANTLPKMVTEWRMHSDFETLAEVPDGTIHLDLLKRTATHSKVGVLNLEIVGELTAWMNSRLTANGIPISELKEAVVEVEFRTDLVPTDRSRIISFDLKCKSRIATANKSYERKQIGNHAYHRRSDA